MKSRVNFAVVMVLLLCASVSEAGWQSGEFQSGGKPVGEHHCAPATPGAHPAVIVLYSGLGYADQMDQYEDVCLDLAERGYFVESIEYFSQTVAPSSFSRADAANLPTFDREIRSGLDALTTTECDQRDQRSQAE